MANSKLPKGFEDRYVLAFESRMAEQMRGLISRFGGNPFVAPSMREIPLEVNDEVFKFGTSLHNHEIDILILLTGVGTRAMLEVLDTKWEREQTLSKLRNILLVTRGPKPLQVLREIALQATINVPEPNTWRDILDALGGEVLEGKNVAVQEYGVSNPSLLQGLRDRGAVVKRVPVYRWALPEDLNPLLQAIDKIINHHVDVVLFTSAVQVEHLLEIAKRNGHVDRLKKACSRMMVGSIGPMASERLCLLGFPVDFEPTHSKMGVFVKEASQCAEEILLKKRKAAGTSIYGDV